MEINLSNYEIIMILVGLVAVIKSFLHPGHKKAEIKEAIAKAQNLLAEIDNRVTTP
jgi:hypothetical protein